MKTTRIIFASLLAGALFSGCKQESIDPSGRPETGQILELAASWSDGADTKTALQSDGTSVWWTTSEYINVFYGDAMAGMFYSTNVSPSATAVFRGSLAYVDGATGNGTDYWAMYPYEADAVCDGTSVTMTVPTEQQAVAGTFADNLFPALAKSASRDLTFHHVCGGARFSVTENGISSVTFRAVGEEAIAGKLKVGFSSAGEPEILQVVDGASSVTVKAPQGGFEVGKDYFVALLPQVLVQGLAITFEGTTQSATKVLDRPITIHRAVFGTLDDADEGVWGSAHQYFTITSLEDGNTISFVPTELEEDGSYAYSLDYGEWIDIGNRNDLAAFSVTLSASQKLRLKGSHARHVFRTRIGIPKRANVSGNVLSLVNGDDFLNDYTIGDSAFDDLFHGPDIDNIRFVPDKIVDASDLILPSENLAKYCFTNMFFGCSDLIEVPKLQALVLAEGCYSSMFDQCRSLTAPPELPATTLADYCYDMMFFGCSSLMVAPDLPATTLAHDCYRAMFEKCKSLTVAPELPAESLAPSCYGSMFRDCTSLTVAPELPAESLAPSCYSWMFSGCTSLTVAPELPTESLESGCYAGMFSGCTSLTVAPELPATMLANECYSIMFSGCTSLTVAPELPATTLAGFYCYQNMFSGCSSLSYIKALFTTTPSDDYYNYTRDWVNGVAETGTFVKSADATWDVVGPNGVPEGWTVQMEGEASGGTEGIGYDEWQ